MASINCLLDKTKFSWILFFVFSVSMVVWNANLQTKLGEVYSASNNEEDKLNNLEETIKRLGQQINQQQQQHIRQRRAVRSPPQPAGSPAATVFIHWGRSTCPNTTHMERVYEGIVGGSWFDQTGGGSNYLCLHRNPEWNKIQSGGDSAWIYGTEFKAIDTILGHDNAKKLDNHDVVCAVCRVQIRATHIMVPGRRQCPRDWTKEYEGYLMAVKSNAKGRTEFICMDENPEAEPKGYEDKKGAMMHKVSASCGSLPCPNYVNNHQLTCVVCTK